MMINKNRFRISNDKKVLHKIGKRWVTVSALTLALLGGAAAASTVTTHADATTIPAVEAQHTDNVKKQINSNLNSAANSNNAKSTTTSAQSSSATKPSAVQSSAANMHNALLQNAANQKPSAKSASSSVASNAPIHQSAQPNSAYEAYLKQNPQLVQDYYGNATPSANSKAVSNAPKDNVSASSITSNSSASSVSANNSKVSSANQISDKKNKPLMKAVLSQNNNITAHGTFDGNVQWTLNNGNFSMNGGTLPNGRNLTNLLPSNYYNNIENIYTHNVKAPDAIPDFFGSLRNLQYADLSGLDVSNTTYMQQLFETDYKLEHVKMNNLKTHNVHKIYGMFWDCYSLKDLDVSNWDTSNVDDMNGFVGNDGVESAQLSDLDISGFNTIKASQNHYANVGLPGPNNGIEYLIYNDKKLKNLHLGTNTILTNDAIDGDASLSYAQDVNSGVPFGEDLIQLADGQAHPGTFQVFHGKGGQYSGNPGSALWALGNNGTLYLENGALDVPASQSNFKDWGSVKKIVYHNISGGNNANLPQQMNDIIGDKNKIAHVKDDGFINQDSAANSAVNNDINIINSADSYIENHGTDSGNSAVAHAENADNDANNAFSDIEAQSANATANAISTLASEVNTDNKTINSDNGKISSLNNSLVAESTSASNTIAAASTNASNSASSAESQAIKNADATAEASVNAASQSASSSVASLANSLSASLFAASSALNWIKTSGANASAQANDVDAWVKANSASLSNASITANNAKTSADDAMNSLTNDSAELSWLASSESALSTGSSQASSNAGWIANNSASVSALSQNFHDVYNKIQQDSTALNQAIGSKADTSDLTNKYNALSGDITNASSLASDADNLAKGNAGEISNLKANTAITFTFTMNGNQFHSPVTLTNSYIENNAQPTGNTQQGNPGTYNVNGILNVSAPEGYSVDGQYTVTIGKDSNGIANIQFGTHSVGAMAPTKPRRHFGMMLLGAMPRLFGAKQVTPQEDPNSNDVKLIGNEAEYSGTITLKFGNKTATVHYDTGKNNQNVRTGDTINLLQYAHTKANAPSDYTKDNLINGFDTTGFSFAKNGSTPYQITVKPSDAKTTGQSNPKNITLNYSAQTVNDTINYDYQGKSEGTDATTGIDDAQATWTNNDVKGLKPGWKLANPTNNFNIVKGTTNINVVPIKRTDTINYIDQKGDNVGTQQFTGNDKNATDAGDNSIDVNSSNTKLDSDYSLNSKDNTFNYDGGTYTVNVTGKARSTKNPIKPDNNSDPTDAKNDKSNKNMPTPPKSDDSVLFTIHVNDYTADGKLIGSHTKYATETGKFGDHFTVNAADYQTYGFNIKSGTDKSVTGVIGDKQLNPNNATFDYYAKQYNPADAAQYANDPTYPKPITVQYIGEKNGQASQVIETKQITGDTGTTGNVEKQVPVPQGYTADSNPSYTITTQAQTIKINLTSVSHKHKAGTKSPSDTTNPDNPANPTNSQNPTNPNNPNGTTNPNNPNSPLDKGNKHHQDTTGTKGQTNPWNPSSSNSPYNPKNPDSPFNPNSPLNPNKTGGNDDPTNPNSPLDPQNPNSPLNPSDANSPLNPKNNSYEPNHPENDPWNPNNPDSPLSPTNPISPYNPNNPDSPLDSKGNQAKYNAKNGIATVIVTKLINGKLIGGYSGTVNEDDMATGEQRTISAPTVNGYNVTGANGFTVTMNGDGSLTNGAHTFVYVVDASKIAPISITFRNQNGDYVDKSTGNLTNDYDAATTVISADQLAKLGAVGDYVDVTGFFNAPEGYSFAGTTKAAVENNSNKLNHIQLVAPKVSLGNPLGAIHLSLMADVPEPKPAPKPTPTSNVTPSAASSEANSAASSAAQSASASAGASAASAEQSAVNSVANSAAQNNGSAVTSTEQSMAKADASNEAHDNAVASAARSAAGSAEASADVSAADEVRSAEADHNDSKAIANVKASAASAERSAAKSAAQSAKTSATDSVEDSIASSEDNQEAHASQNSEAPSAPVEHSSQMIGGQNAEPSHEVNVQREAASHMVGSSNKLAQPSTTVHASRVGSNDQNANGHKLPQTNEAKAAGLMGASAIMAALGLAGTDVDRKRRRE